MLVVAQCRLDFGSADQPAIVRHLHTYHFKSLLNPKRKAAAWLREHATECVVWAAEKAKMCDDDSKDENKTKNDNDDVDGEESLLKEMEKEALRCAVICESPGQWRDDLTFSTGQKEDHNDDDAKSSTSIDSLDLLRKAVSWSHLVYDTGKCSTCWWKRRRNELSKERETAAPVAKISAEEEQSEHPECRVAATRPQQGDVHPNCPSSGRELQSPESTPGIAGPQEGMFSLCWCFAAAKRDETWRVSGKVELNRL